jgi:hypothetical protein
MADPEQRTLASVTMRFGVREHLVSAVSRLVSDFCGVVLGNADLSSRLYMAAHELCENLAKYADGSQSVLSLELEERDDLYIIRIAAKNLAAPERLSDVERRLAELTSAGSAVEHYDKLIRETAGREGVSGLGLARIQAEGGFELDYTISGDEVTIVAQTEVIRKDMRAVT